MAVKADAVVVELEARVAEYGRRINRAERNFSNKMDEMRRSAGLTERRNVAAFNNVSQSANRMSSMVTAAISAIAVGLAGREVIQYADAWTEAGNKIAAAGTALEDQQERLSELAETAIETRSSFDATASLYARLGIATENLTGKSYDLLKITELINKATVAGGASTAERNSTVIQLSQALASGQLMGEELRALRENAPLLLKAIAQEFGVTIGELKELGAEGELTAERILDGIVNAQEGIEARFSKTNVTIGDSFENLKTRVTEYIGTADDSLGMSEKLSGAIMYVAENVDAFAEALVIAGAALTGALGAAAVGSAVQGLSSVGALIMGPGGLILGAGALAAAFAYLALRGDDVSRSMKSLDGTLRAYQNTTDDIEADTAQLADLQDRLTQAIENQQPVIEATARADIAALNDRIAKNKELQAVLATTARAELARLETELQQSSSPFAGFEAPRDYRAEGEGRSAAGINRGDSGISVVASDEAESAKLVRQIQQQMLKDIEARVDAGELITQQEQEVLDRVSKRLQTEQRIASLREQVATLGEEPASATTTTSNTTTSTGGGDGNTEAKINAIDKIAEAHRQMFQAEADQIEHNYQAQIAAINATKAAEADKEKAREQARAIADQELVELEKREDEKAARQQDFAEMVMASRDQMLGNLASMLDREYRLKEDQIRAELKDAAELEDALLALKEERLAAEKDLRDQVLQEGRYADDELSRFEAYYDERQAILEDALEQEKITKEEHDQEIAEMDQARRDMEREAEIANQQMILSATAGFVSALGDLARKRFGENSALAKAFFLAEKIAAAGHVVLNAEVAKIRALAELGPIAGPPAASAIEVAKNLSLATIAATTVAGFKDGVIGIDGPGTSRSDSIPARLSRGESVITAKGTALNPNLLDRINRGVDVESQLARINQPVNVNPAYFSSGARPINVTGSSMTFTGPINEDTLPQVKALIDERDRQLEGRVQRAIDRDKKRSTPRHERERFLKG